MEFDPVTLDIVRQLTYEDINPEFEVTADMLPLNIKGVASAAHSQYDHATGESFNFALKFGSKSTYTIFSISDTSPNGLKFHRNFSL